MEIEKLAGPENFSIVIDNLPRITRIGTDKEEGTKYGPGGAN